MKMAYEQLWSDGVELAYLQDRLKDVQISSPEAVSEIYDIAEALNRAGDQHLRKVASRTVRRHSYAQARPWSDLGWRADDLFFSLERGAGDTQKRLEELDSAFLRGVGYLIGRETGLDFTESQAA